MKDRLTQTHHHTIIRIHENVDEKLFGCHSLQQQAAGIRQLRLYRYIPLTPNKIKIFSYITSSLLASHRITSKYFLISHNPLCSWGMMGHRLCDREQGFCVLFPGVRVCIGQRGPHFGLRACGPHPPSAIMYIMYISKKKRGFALGKLILRELF